MAQLTSNIGWLVSQTVALPDGTTKSASSTVGALQVTAVHDVNITTGIDLESQFVQISSPSPVCP